MSPEAATTTQPAPPAESKRAAMKQLSAAAIRVLCEIKANERIDAQRALEKAEKAFQKKGRELDADHRKLADAHEEAKAEVEAHKDYLKPGGPVELGDLTRQEYDAEHRGLEAHAKSMEEALNKGRESVMETMAPFRKAVQDADRLVQDLTRAWKAHERRANEAGVDISACWTPDRALPAEAAPIDASAPTGE